MQHFLIALNFSRQPEAFALPDGIEADALLIGSDPRALAADGSRIELGGWEAWIYRYLSKLKAG